MYTSLKLTASLHLKMDGRGRENLSSWWAGLFFGAFAVGFREEYFLRLTT